MLAGFDRQGKSGVQSSQSKNQGKFSARRETSNAKRGTLDRARSTPDRLETPGADVAVAGVPPRRAPLNAHVFSLEPSITRILLTYNAAIFQMDNNGFGVPSALFRV